MNGLDYAKGRLLPMFDSLMDALEADNAIDAGEYVMTLAVTLNNVRSDEQLLMFFIEDLATAGGVFEQLDCGAQAWQRLENLLREAEDIAQRFTGPANGATST